MPKLTDDPKVQELITRAEARGANAERKRINALIGDAASVEGIDKGAKSALRDLKKSIREDA